MKELKMKLLLLVAILTTSNATPSLESLADELNVMKEQVQELLFLKEQVDQLVAVNLELQRQVKGEHLESSSTSDDVEERLEKLEELSRVGTLRTCDEYSAFGLKTSGQYLIDPDGHLVGEPPFTVFCNFDEDSGRAVTEVFHNSENVSDIEHCHDPGCFSKNITYTDGIFGEPVPISQIDALIALSRSCDQSFYYECTLAPLRDEGLDYGFWRGRRGEKNVYFTGGDSSFHACDCHFTEEGCMEEELKGNTCNCDSNLPAPLFDTGVISNMSALPILSISFGGLTFDIQQGAYKIGRLSCQGEKEYATAESCETLKLAGETHSGYFTVKKYGNIHTSTVYCDMSKGGYTSVPEDTQLSSDSPLGTISAWIPRNNNSETNYALPDGWLPCDGRMIEKGPWQGGKTPDLNTDGRFLRGGTEETVLQMEADQVLDHQHTDPGHTHSNSPHTHGYDDGYSSTLQRLYAGSENHYGTQTYHAETTASATVAIASAKTSIGGVSSEYRSGSENRPRNMKVLWVIKLW